MISQMWGGTQTDSVQFNWFNLNFPTELQFFFPFHVLALNRLILYVIPFVCVRTSESLKSFLSCEWRKKLLHFLNLFAASVFTFSVFLPLSLPFIAISVLCRLVNRFLLIGVFILFLVLCFGSKEKWMVRKVRKLLSTMPRTRLKRSWTRKSISAFSLFWAK